MAQALTFTAVVVVYNIILNDSASLSSLLGQGWDEIIVCDNSTQPNENRAAAQELGVEYISMGGNMGLSAAYNRAINAARGSITVLFDSDTQLPDDFLRRLSACAAQHEGCGLFVPTVFDRVGLLSPCRINGCRTRRLKSAEALPEDFSAINSALAVRTALARRILYDEAIFLDYADHDFIRRCRRAGAEATVFKVDIIQQFSGSSTDIPKSSALVRFKIFVRDVRTFSGKHNCRLNGECVLLRHMLALIKKYRSAAFLGGYLPRRNNRT